MAPDADSGEVLTLRLTAVSLYSIRKVRGAISEWHDPEGGKILRVLDPFGRETLIDPHLKIRVNPKIVQHLNEHCNVTDGRYEIS